MYYMGLKVCDYVPSAPLLNCELLVQHAGAEAVPGPKQRHFGNWCRYRPVWDCCRQVGRCTGGPSGFSTAHFAYQDRACGDCFVPDINDIYWGFGAQVTLTDYEGPVLCLLRESVAANASCAAATGSCPLDADATTPDCYEVVSH